jgi:hypothetical protein
MGERSMEQTLMIEAVPREKHPLMVSYGFPYTLSFISFTGLREKAESEKRLADISERHIP